MEIRVSIFWQAVTDSAWPHVTITVQPHRLMELNHADKMKRYNSFRLTFKDQKQTQTRHDATTRGIDYVQEDFDLSTGMCWGCKMFIPNITIFLKLLCLHRPNGVH